MKYSAYTDPEGNNRIVTIYDVIKGRKGDHPEDWEEGKIYYSLWYYTPMKAIVKVTKKKPHFAFVNGVAAGHNEGGESLEHSLSKQIVSELKELKVSVYGRSYVIPIEKGRIEHPETFKEWNYRIDVLLEVSKCPFVEEFGSDRIGIEIKKSNGLKARKTNHIRRLSEQIVLLEVLLWDEIKLGGDNDVELLYRRLLGYWEKGVKAVFAHNPNYKEGFKKYQENKERERQNKIEERKRLILESQTIKPKLARVIPQKPVVVEPKQRIKESKKSRSLFVGFFIVIMILLFVYVFYGK